MRKPSQGAGAAGAVGSSCILAWMPLALCRRARGISSVLADYVRAARACAAYERRLRERDEWTHLDKVGQLLLEVLEARLLDLVLLDELGLGGAELLALLLEPAGTQRATSGARSRKGGSDDGREASAPFPLGELER